MSPNQEALALRFLKRGAPIHKLSFFLGIGVEELRNIDVWETLYQLARSGRHPAVTMFWVKTRSSKPQAQDDGPLPPPPIIQVVDEFGNVYE